MLYLVISAFQRIVFFLQFLFAKRRSWQWDFHASFGWVTRRTANGSGSLTNLLASSDECFGAFAFHKSAITIYSVESSTCSWSLSRVSEKTCGRPHGTRTQGDASDGGPPCNQFLGSCCRNLIAEQCDQWLSFCEIDPDEMTRANCTIRVFIFAGFI